MAAILSRQIVLASRPSGVPSLENFRVERVPLPPVGEGEMLLRTLYLSLDPYMRGQMSEGRSFTEPVPLGGVMIGETVARVVDSRLPGFEPGDLVLSFHGWQEYAVSTGAEATLSGGRVAKLDPAMAHPSYALGVLGMTGFTAHYGLLDIGQPRPGDTVVVAAATGAVGSVVGQIARLKGCRAVGLAGGPEKCRYAVEELGFDHCIDHRSEPLGEQLAAVCPSGIDVYFENVGGRVLEAVLPLLNQHARIPLCGLLAYYSLDGLPMGPDQMPILLGALLNKRIKMEGFIIGDHPDRWDAFRTDMSRWIGAGDIKVREHVVDGLDHAPEAFIGLLQGHNFGKVVVRVAD